MLLLRKDKEDKVIAYVEYTIVDKYGHPCEVGQYCWVRDIWVHRSIRHQFTLKDFVEEGHEKFPTVRWLYYKRGKYNDRMSIYDITRFYNKRRK